MSIVSSLAGSESDMSSPKTKSYWGYGFDIFLVPVDSFRTKKDPSPTEKRMLQFDLDEKENIENVIILNTPKNPLGKYTPIQIEEILSDMGFNVHPTFAGKHLADIEAVMNVGGYSIPGWVRIARTITKVLPSREKLLLTKLSPGRDRLHIVAYQDPGGPWIFAAHTDFNWLNLNLPKIYKAHVGHGAGDYITGTLMFFNLLKLFVRKSKENKSLKVKEIEEIIRSAYAGSIKNKLSL